MRRLCSIKISNKKSTFNYIIPHIYRIDRQECNIYIYLISNMSFSGSSMWFDGGSQYESIKYNTEQEAINMEEEILTKIENYYEYRH